MIAKTEGESIRPRIVGQMIRLFYCHFYRVSNFTTRLLKDGVISSCWMTTEEKERRILEGLDRDS